MFKINSSKSERQPEPRLETRLDSTSDHVLGLDPSPAGPVRPRLLPVSWRWDSGKTQVWVVGGCMLGSAPWTQEVRWHLSPTSNETGNTCWIYRSSKMTMKFKTANFQMGLDQDSVRGEGQTSTSPVAMTTSSLFSSSGFLHCITPFCFFICSLWLIQFLLFLFLNHLLFWPLTVAKGRMESRSSCFPQTTSFWSESSCKGSPWRSDQWPISSTHSSSSSFSSWSPTSSLIPPVSGGEMVLQLRESFWTSSCQSTIFCCPVLDSWRCSSRGGIINRLLCCRRFLSLFLVPWLQWWNLWRM